MRQLLLLVLIFLSLCILNVKSEDIILKCDESVPNEPFCTVSSFIVSHSQNIKIQNYQKANMTKFMKFYASRLLYVPYKLFDVFTNLKTLDVSFTEILDIPRNTFGAATFLTYLNMSHNNLTSINTSVFSGANNLIRLDLSYNQITEMSEYAFRGLTSLDKLQLSYNKLLTLGKDIFSENPYMESVYLDNNLLTYIEPEVFNRFRRIREVNLSNNKIHFIHPNTFQAAYVLENLILDHNQLCEFQLSNKSIATQLVLDYNNLTHISINGTKYVSAKNNRINTLEMINSIYLESLQLNYNNIRDISNITNVTELLYLDLSNNPIGPLNITTFDRMRWLWSLKLRAAGVNRLEFGMFSKIQKLELLDLSYNNLTSLNLDIFLPYLVTLKELYVDANNLTEIQGKHTISSAFPNLQILGISGNRFNCSYLHNILTYPSLSSAVELHIEPSHSDEVTSHIRDVACENNIKITDDIDAAQLKNQYDAHELLLQQLKQHAHRLEIYLLLLKISLFIVINLTVVLIILQVWKFKNRNYFTRSAGSIIFRSDATVNTNIEHHP